MDHKIVIDGVVFREKKEMTTEMTHVVADNFKQCICQFVHSRSIGDRVYVYKFTETATNGVLDGECLKKVKTDVDEDEVQKLGDEWEAKWKPSIGYQPDSGIGALIKKMLNVENWKQQSMIHSNEVKNVSLGHFRKLLATLQLPTSGIWYNAKI